MTSKPPEADPAAWLARARGDLHAARVLPADADSPSWATGFHIQQAAEKALKGLLVAHGSTPPRTHDLDDLCARLTLLDPAFGPWEDRLEGLRGFSVAERYPGFETLAADLVGAIDAVAELLVAVQDRLGGPGAP